MVELGQTTKLAQKEESSNQTTSTDAQQDDQKFTYEFKEKETILRKCCSKKLSDLFSNIIDVLASFIGINTINKGNLLKTSIIKSG